jgi:hypothetical protein
MRCRLAPLSGRKRIVAPDEKRFEALKANGLLRDPKNGGYSSPAFELAMEGPGAGGQALSHLAPTPAAEGDRRPFSGCRRPPLQTVDSVGTFACLISGASWIEPALPGGRGRRPCLALVL